MIRQITIAVLYITLSTMYNGDIGLISLPVKFFADSTGNRLVGRCLFSFIPCVFKMIKYGFNVADMFM